MLVRKTFLELDVELAAGFQQHCDTQQHISLLVHNQCLISHEDDIALAFNSGHWKNYICTLSDDSVTSDAFQQDGLPLVLPLPYASWHTCSCAAVSTVP